MIAPLLLVVVVAAAWLLMNRNGDDPAAGDGDGIAMAGATTEALPTTSAAGERDREPTTTTIPLVPTSSLVTTTDGSSSETTTTTTNAPQPIELDLSNATASATAERSSVVLRCDQLAGSNELTTYAAENLIDGDMNTGWGAGQDDGRGESVTIDLGQVAVLTHIGLTPGFAKVGPRSDNNCRTTEAFPHNAFVASVEYTFDDGSSVVQQFEQRKDLQTIDLEDALGGPVRSQQVTITILQTIFPPGADEDTILSEAMFWGFWGFA